MGVDHVLVGDDEQVAWRDGSDIEEGAGQLITVEEARRRFAGDDPAEDAVRHRSGEDTDVAAWPRARSKISGYCAFASTAGSCMSEATS